MITLYVYHKVLFPVLTSTKSQICPCNSSEVPLTLFRKDLFPLVGKESMSLNND